MPKIIVENQELFYALHRGGDEAQVSLVLIHGAAGSHLDWPKEVRQLPHTAVVALDLPGHGRSVGPGRDSIEGYTAVVNAFITQLGLEKVVLLGHSMGGAIAQKLGRDQPDWLAGLILLGTAATMPVSPAILTQIETDYPAVIEFLVKYQWARDVPDALRELSRQRLAQNDTAVVYADFAACNQFDARPYLAEIKVPTLIIGGTKDKMTPFPESEYLAATIPHAELVAIPDAGHFLALEQPEAVATAVGGFISRL